MPVSDSALRKIVGWQFQRHTVAIHHFNTVTAEPARHGRQHCFACVELDRKHSSLEFLDDFADYFYGIFFRQICTLPAITTPPLAAAATAAAAISTAATAISAATRSFRTSFIDVQRSAVQVCAIQAVDCILRFGIDCHFDECEASWLPGIPVGNNVNAIYGSVRLEHGTKRIFGCSEAKVAYKNVFHSGLFLEVAEQLIAARIEQRAANRTVRDFAKIGVTDKRQQHGGTSGSRKQPFPEGWQITGWTKPESDFLILRR